ncbi:MAG: two-component regulator propeller domain-containing protein [Bryobacteraceae bacterium]|nr:two-component regulator propeller domain-containing protein [Bryobacteraceae bacterium]
MARVQPIWPLLLCWTCAYGLDPSLDISQYAHTAWKVRDGFGKGVFESIAQTPDGYLWIGTEFGLVRFDGVRPLAWAPPGQKLPGERVRRLLVSRDGALVDRRLRWTRAVERRKADSVSRVRRPAAWSAASGSRRHRLDRCGRRTPVQFL